FVGIGDDELDATQASARQLAQELGPDRLGLGCADLHTQNFATAVAVDANRDDDRHRDDPSPAAHLRIGRINPQIRPVALDRPFEEGLHLAVDLLAQPRHLALRDAAHAHRLDQIVDRTRRDALDIGLLDHGRQRLLGHAAWLQKAGEVASLPELGNAQLDRARPRLPVTVPVAITLGRPKRVLLAIGGSGRRSHLHLHQPLRGKADHLAQKISIRRLLHEGSQVHHVVGHRWSFRNGVGVATRPYRKAPMTTDMPLARYSAVNGALTSGFVIAELHHLTGRDRRCCSLEELQKRVASETNLLDWRAVASETDDMEYVLADIDSVDCRGARHIALWHCNLLRFDSLMMRQEDEADHPINGHCSTWIEPFHRSFLPLNLFGSFTSLSQRHSIEESFE